MLYNVVLVSAIHQHESAIGIYMSLMLKLKPQYRWLDSITDSMDMNFSKLQETV